MMGCHTHTPRRRPKPQSPDPTASGHGDLAAYRAPDANSGAQSEAPKRWVGFPAERRALMSRGNLKGDAPTGGSAEQASKHRARDAEGTGGLAVPDFRTALAPRGTKVRGSSGAPASRAPSDLSRDAHWK